MIPISKRLAREHNTVQKMVAIYCRSHHISQANSLCTDCQSLLDYADQRIQHCPYGLYKPSCAKCPIHCYRTEMREQIRQVMRFAGPRMILHHPWLALLHLLDSLRKPPER